MKFKLKSSEFENRHRLVFELFEKGNLTLDEYLNLALFYKKRSFSKAQFRSFMFAQSKPIAGMIELIRDLRARYPLKVFILSNEGRELNAYRVKKFHLDDFVDSFISSSFVKLRKPDPDIFRLALDIAQADPRRVLYIENTPMFIEIAKGFGIQTILHNDYHSTCQKLSSFGLVHEAK